MTNTEASYITNDNTLVRCEIIKSKKVLFGGIKYLIAYTQKTYTFEGKELYTTRKAEWVDESKIIK